MCIVKTPKIKDTGSTSDTDKSKPPLPILRNPFLDGLAGSINAIRLGRGSLRIDRIRDGSTGSPLGGGSPASVGGSIAIGGGGGTSSGGSSFRGGGGSREPSNPYEDYR